MPNDRWDAPNIPKPVKLPTGRSLGPKDKQPMKIVHETLPFDEKGMYIPRSKRYGRK